MQINKRYNHQTLENIKKNIVHTIDPDKLKTIFNRFISSNLQLLPLESFNFNSLFKVSKFTRPNNITNLLYDSLFRKQYQHDEFAFLFESNKINYDRKVLTKYYPIEWSDALIIYELDFLSYAKLQFLENECHNYIKLISNDAKIIINIIYSSKITSNTYINSLIYHIHNILNWMISINDVKITKFRIDILLCPFNKTFTYQFEEDDYIKYPWLLWTKNMKDDCMSRFNINTGLSWIGINHIVLFRIDEIFKVFLHECIHSLKYDYNDINDCNKQRCETILKHNVKLKIGNIKSNPILINEAYTEYLAILCWNFYLLTYYFSERLTCTTDIFSCESSGIISDYYKFNLYLHMINRELINSAIMCKKLFDYYNITNINILNDYNHIEQFTSAFSYIFIKYIFLVNLIGIFNNKNVNDINELLINVFNDITSFNYLLNIPSNNNDKLFLSIYYLTL